MKKTICFDYLYRDSGNNKVHGTLLLVGTIDPEQVNEFKSYLNGGEWFVAEQVGIPPLYDKLLEHSGGATDEDTPFHEFCCFRYPTKDDIASNRIFSSVKVFVDRFKHASGRWDVSKSKLYL